MLKVRNDSSMYSVIEKTQFVDVAKIVAYDKVRMLMGGGIEFKHKDKEMHDIWHRFVDLNDFYNFMFTIEQYMSTMGACFVAINHNVNGEPVLTIPNVYYSYQVESAFGRPDCASFVEQVSIGNKVNLVKSFYDTEKIIRTLWTSDEANIKGKLDIQEYVTSLPKEKQVDYGTYDPKLGAYVKYHNLGFCPVVLFINKPYLQHNVVIGSNYAFQSPFLTTINYNNTGWNYNSICDTAKCSGLIEQLQNAYTQANKLMILDKPRLVISGLNQITANKLRQDKQLLGAYLKDIMINTGTQGGEVKTIAPTNTLNYYYEFITNTWKDIYRACGLSYATQTSVQKTAQESNSSYEQSIQEINFLRNFHIGQWIELIKKMFKLVGKEIGDKNSWSFQVKRNLVIDEGAKLNNMITQIQNGLKTIPQAIATLEGIDEDNAENIWEENKKWFEDNDIQITNAKQDNELAMGGASLTGSKENGGRPQKIGE